MATYILSLNRTVIGEFKTLEDAMRASAANIWEFDRFNDCWDACEDAEDEDAMDVTGETITRVEDGVTRKVVTRSPIIN